MPLLKHRKLHKSVYGDPGSIPGMSTLLCALLRATSLYIVLLNIFSWRIRMGNIYRGNQRVCDGCAAKIAKCTRRYRGAKWRLCQTCAAAIDEELKAHPERRNDSENDPFAEYR